MALEIDVLPLLQDNFGYVLHNRRQAAVVDPGEAAPVLRHLETAGLRLELILCTHHHADHVGGAKALAERYRCPVWASKWDLDRIAAADRGLDETDEPLVFNEKMRVLHVPGHTAGQICFYFPDMNALFTGDTLFSLGCGRLFEGTPEQMFSSLKKIAALPENTRLYFGHEYTLRNGEFCRGITPSKELEEYLTHVSAATRAGRPSTPTTLSREKTLNPFLNTASLAEWTRRRTLRNAF